MHCIFFANPPFTNEQELPLVQHENSIKLVQVRRYPTPTSKQTEQNVCNIGEILYIFVVIISCITSAIKSIY